MSLYDRNPPPLPMRPRGVAVGPGGYAAAAQAQCAYGRFGDTNVCGHSMTSRRQQILPVDGEAGVTFFGSNGMATCSAVFMRHGNGVGAVAAVIHYDGLGDPGEMFLRVLGYYQLANAVGIAETETCIVTHAVMDATGKSAYKSLKSAGFILPSRYKHNGSAAMDSQGRFFDHYA